MTRKGKNATGNRILQYQFTSKRADRDASDAMQQLFFLYWLGFDEIQRLLFLALLQRSLRSTRSLSQSLFLCVQCDRLERVWSDSPADNQLSLSPTSGRKTPSDCRKMAVVVFDFDHTIIDDNSDTWVVEELGLTDLFNQLRRTMPWTSLMVRIFFCKTCDLGSVSLVI